MDKQKMCDKCEEHEGTHRLFYEMLCDECYPRAKALSDAERRASGRQIDYAELALGIEERDAELARLRAELEQARVQLAGCLCASEGTGDADKVKQGDYAWTPALQRTVELRAALASAERERDEARKQRDFAKDGEDNMRFLKALWENECGFYRAQSVARLHEIDMSRRTIGLVVVAARAIKKLLWLRLARDIVKLDNTDDPDELVKQMREMVEAERQGKG